MKFARYTVCVLAAAALIAGCGKSSSPVSVTPESTPSLDNTAPPVPSGFTVVDDPSTGASSLAWDASSAADVVAYEVYSYDPDPERETSYVLQYTTDGVTTRFSVDPSSTYVTHYFRVRAVDAAGNRSGLSDMHSVTSGPVVNTNGGPSTMTP